MNKEQCYAECERIAGIAKQHESKAKQHYDLARSEVVAVRYGIGGEILHRGWYCPSMVADIINGNVKRGSVIDVRPADSKLHYIYGFNKDDQLITVETSTNYEVITKDNNYTTGFTFNKMFNTIETICECIYLDDRTGSYGLYLYDPEIQQVKSFTKEKYTYENDRLNVDLYEFVNTKKPVLIHERYLFSIVDGFLSSYTVEEYDGSDQKESIWDGHSFHVRAHRNIDGWRQRVGSLASCRQDKSDN